jgi:hypothetical protein
LPITASSGLEENIKRTYLSELPGLPKFEPILQEVEIVEVA